jgi:hypothetical protein
MLAFISSALFLIMTVFSSSSIFNFLPYMLHETFAPGGVGESSFIIGFDIVCSVLVFYIAFKIVNNMLTRK